MSGSRYEEFYVKRANRQEPRRSLEKFVVRFEGNLTFCEVYPTNCFQTDKTEPMWDKMIGNAIPFHGNVVAVIKFRARRDGLTGSSPVLQTLAMVLMMRRELLVAKLLKIDESDVMEELFWSLSEQYPSDDKVSLRSAVDGRYDQEEVSDRAMLRIDRDEVYSRDVNLYSSIVKRIVQVSPNREKEKMYVVRLYVR